MEVTFPKALLTDEEPVTRRLDMVRRQLRVPYSEEHEINRLYHNSYVSIHTLHVYYGYEREDLEVLLRLRV